MAIERIIEILRDDENAKPYYELGYETPAEMSDDWDKAFDIAIDILKQINNCNEKSASKCWECINLIKEKNV